MNNLKLFIWRGFFTRYGYGLAFSIAKDKDEAVRMIKEEVSKRGDEIYDFGPLEVFSLEKSMSFYKG